MRSDKILGGNSDYKYFSAIPYVGKQLAEWLWGGFSVANPTLNRFFIMHFIIFYCFESVCLWVCVVYVCMPEIKALIDLLIDWYPDGFQYDTRCPDSIRTVPDGSGWFQTVFSMTPDKG